jgi:hypothetical protein
MRKITLVLVFAMLALLASIALGVVASQKLPGSTDSADGQTLPPEAQRRVLHLVIRSMYDEVDDATGTALDEELRALTREETRLFLDFSFVIQTIGGAAALPANTESIVPLPRQRYVLSLVERALYGEAASEQLQAEIAALSEAEHDLYRKLSEALPQVVSPRQAGAYLPADLVALREAMLCVMDKEGASFIDIRKSDDEIKLAVWECGYTPPQPTSATAPTREAP